MLLHGFTQTSASWRPVRAALGARYKAIAPDLPGHGSFAARPASFSACDAYVRVLTRGPFALAGYSMGGRIALHAALSAGSRLTRLVLVAAGPGLADPAERAARRRDAKFRDIAERMGAALPHARLVVVPGAGHALPLEAPDAVAAALEAA